jgi:N-acetylglutamate synthase-like GNAT family acetyltransferase
MKKDSLSGVKLRRRKPLLEDYIKLFNTTGWNELYEFTQHDFKTMLSRIWFMSTAYSGSQLIGMGGILSDGAHHALFSNVIIHPDFQNKGIGKKIILNLLDESKKRNIRDIQLFAAPETYGFYEKCGFTKRELNAPGMEFFFK